MKAALIALSLLLATPTWAYNLDTIASDSCHEKLTVEALLTILEIFETQDIPVPADDVLYRLMGSVNVLERSDLSESEKFILLSMVVGVRSPDTDGHSTLNLAALRRLHADPTPEGQYAHALRGPDDDYVPGDIAAVDGTLRLIRSELDAFFSVTNPTGPAATGKRGFFIEHYGRVDVTVFLPAYHLGRAIHALQDAHAHMVWNDDVSHVVHVLNYVDAVNATRKTDRDGMAHSGALDDCERADTQPMVVRATQRSTVLTASVLIAVSQGDRRYLDVGLNPCPDDLSTLPPRPQSIGDRVPENVPASIVCGWIAYNPECRAAIEANDQAAIDQTCCTAANDFCGSKFAQIAKEEPAGPYLGCQSTPGSSLPGSAGWLLAFGLLFALRRFGAAAVAPVLVGVIAPDARAEPSRAEPSRAFASVEGHASILNDTPNASLLDVTFGYSVRTGYRWDRWRAVLHLEQNAWMRTEYGIAVDAGAFNLGVGGEVLFYDGLIRSALVIGPSVLLFDTQLDDAGSTGVFTEVRPLGFRYAVADEIRVTFDPLTITIVAPVTGDPPLRKIERRSYVGVEFGFL